jgi:hypothetical protein
MDLCCGWAAAGQVYLRMHEATGDEVFRDAHRLAIAACSEAVERLDKPSFRYGTMGLIAAILAGESDTDMVWDGVLGMSLPRVATR